jgi:hypothetical protein
MTCNPDFLADIREHYEQRVVRSPGSNVTLQDLYDDYRDWSLRLRL